MHSRALALGLLVAAASLPAQGAPRQQSKVTPTGGWHVGIPQKASVAVGIARTREWSDAAGQNIDYDQMFALLEPGLSAGRASVGYMRRLAGVGSAFTVRGSVMRTWRTPWVAHTEQTFFGIEGSLLPVFFLGARFGVFVRPDADAPGRRVLFTADLSVGM